MKGNIKRKIGSILLAGCLALGIGAYVKANAGDHSSEMISREGVQNEFVETCKNLNWPKGYNVPKEIDEEENGSVYQKEWLNTYKNDPRRAEKALEELEKAKKMPYMSKEKCDDATREYFDKILDKAKNGDPSGFEENIKLNAPE